LGRFLDQCERGSGTRVRLADECIDVGEAGVSAKVEFDLHADDGADVDVSVDPNAGLVVSLNAGGDALPTGVDGVDVEPTDLSLDVDQVSVSATVRVPSTTRSGGDPDSDAARDVGTVDDDGPGRDVPPFEDRELLERIYESCETFAEMAEVIDMDVTAETVRRYMIQNGVHEPRTYDTASETADASPHSADADSPPGSPEVVTDGMGLPESVTVDDIVDAVDVSQTIYEVGRNLGVDRMDALEMLQKLDLLEFVMGRLTAETEREVSRDQILERITRAADAR